MKVIYKGRPVSSNVNAPSEAITKKQSKIFNSHPPPKGKSTKNGTEFAKSLNKSLDDDMFYECD